MRTRLATAAPMALLPAALVAQDTHPFSVHDMLAMQRISDPRVSPDGTVVAFTVRNTDLAANRGRTDVWLAALDGSFARRLTGHEANDSQARWARDARDAGREDVRRWATSFRPSANMK
jgi:dipeptidyl aminopeptidase/acylaminoacyl peptidase